MSIKIVNTYDEVQSWKRKITFILDNKEYKVTLYWDEHDGYEILDMSMYELLEKKLAKELQEKDESVGAYLDSLTFDHDKKVSA
jgi:hypothetical protein